MKPDDSIIIKPESGDTVTALDVLKEIQDVLRKRGYLLTHRDDAMLLVKVLDESTMVGRATAYVRQITPRLVEYKAIDWAGDFLKRPVS
jgi:hypothetical protein